jgi:hypothetical protein
VFDAQATWINRKAYSGCPLAGHGGTIGRSVGAAAADDYRNDVLATDRAGAAKRCRRPWHLGLQLSLLYHGIGATP